VTAGTGVAPYSYLWSNGQITAAASGLCPGTYTCTVTDGSGCTVTASATITQPAGIVLDMIPPVTICQGQSTTLNASAMGGYPLGGYTFNWNAPAFTGPSNNVSPTITTTYTVIATDTAGCVSMTPQTVTVTVKPALGVTTSPNVSICPGVSTTLTSTPSGGNGTYLYNWMPGTGSGSTFTVSPAATTTYTITITDGCTTTPATATVTVTVMPLPVVAFTPSATNGCEPLCVTFTDNTTISSGTITGWNWDLGDGTTSSLQNPDPNCYQAGTYTIVLTATSNGGCSTTTTVSNLITVYPQPVANFIFGPQPATLEAPTISFTDLSVDAATWTWDFGDAGNLYEPNTSNQTNPSHMYGDSGTYCVTLVVASLGGCTNSVTNCLVIQPEYTFYIPNAFTPNGDGMNAIFAPKGEHIAEFTMRIFDRWGNMIFKSGSINQGWDGRSLGGEEISQEDVYVYNIEVKDKTGQRHRYIGHVTIVK
jgi:gliding motility-associated-like protein